MVDFSSPFLVFGNPSSRVFDMQVLCGALWFTSEWQNVSERRLIQEEQGVGLAEVVVCCKEEGVNGRLQSVSIWDMAILDCLIRLRRGSIPTPLVQTLSFQ